MSGGQPQPHPLPSLPIDVGQLLIEIEQLRQRVRELETENKHKQIQRDLGEVIQQLNNTRQEHINFKNSRRDELIRHVNIVSRKLFPS